MKSLEEKLNEMTAKHEKDLAETKKEFAYQYVINPHITEEMCKTSIYVGSNLYGGGAWISLGSDGGRYGTTAATLEDALRFAKAFPAAPATFLRQGGVHYARRDYQDAQPDDKSEGELYVCPMWVSIKTSEPSFVLNWFADTEAGSATFQVHIPTYHLPQLGRLEVSIKDIKGGRRVDRCEFHVNHDAIDAQAEQRIKLWSSHETPNNFYQHWVSFYPEEPTVEYMIQQLIDKGTKE